MMPSEGRNEESFRTRAAASLHHSSPTADGDRLDFRSNAI
jgi:hypothetical protein